MYVVTRKDLFPGAQIAQALHAFREFIEEHPTIDKSWYKNSNYIAILSAKDEMELERLSLRLTKKGIKHSLFREPDLNDELTAIAIEPGRDSKRACSSYPLALKEYTLQGIK